MEHGEFASFKNKGLIPDPQLLQSELSDLWQLNTGIQRTEKQELVVLICAELCISFGRHTQPSSMCPVYAFFLI